LLALAGVLVVAGAAKLRAPAPAARALQELRLAGGERAVRLIALFELALGGMCLARPTAALCAVLAGAYGAFALFTARLIGVSRAGAGCGCFGRQGVRAHRGHVVLNVIAGALALAASFAPPAGLASLLSENVGKGALVAAGAGALAWALVLAYTALPDLASAGALDGAPARPPRESPAQRLVEASGSLLDRKVSRRGGISRAALAGTAFAVAPLHYLLRPDPAWAVISPGRCSGGLCTDGYTAFCCEINHGKNVCPTNTYVAGWWKCTNYRGRHLCSGENVRYYVDCNRMPGRGFHGGCQCANGSCNNRRVDCNHFRYGQCNTQIGGITEVVCRLVVCQHPASLAGFNCNHTYKVDDSTCGHEAGCLEPLVEQPVGGGGA
jgi:hypothetical protein